MSKITNYLNEHMTGDVVAGDNYRQKYSTDGSVLSITPHIIVYPRMADDVRKTARFTWRLAERGQLLPLTARGGGTDNTGAAIGRGTIMSFSAHMDQIMEFDLKSKAIRVQAGMNLYALNQAIATQGLMLPIDGDNSRLATVGGAIATNLPGRRYAKYGCTRDWVENLEVVLANGEIITTGRISRRELNEKKGLQTLEGEIYRSIDSLIEDNIEAVNNLAEGTALDAGGYPLDLVRGSDGSFDLTPLFIGSQGTLGIITQAILKLTDVTTHDGMIVAALTGHENLSDLTNLLLETEPAALEFIDGRTLALIRDITDYNNWQSITSSLPYALLFIQYDDKHVNRKIRKAAKILEAAGVLEAKIATEPADIADMIAIYDSVSSVTNLNSNGRTAIPLVTDFAVTPGSVFDAVAEIREQLRDNHVDAGVWGNLGSGLITVLPVINLANLGQRQIVFRLMDKLTEIAMKYRGSLTGCSGPGRLLQPWVTKQYDRETNQLFTQVRRIFDPYNVLNAGVRDNQLKRSDVLAILRQGYSQDDYLKYNIRG